MSIHALNFSLVPTGYPIPKSFEEQPFHSFLQLQGIAQQHFYSQLIPADCAILSLVDKYTRKQINLLWIDRHLIKTILWNQLTVVLHPMPYPKCHITSLPDGEQAIALETYLDSIKTLPLMLKGFVSMLDGSVMETFWNAQKCKPGLIAQAILASPSKTLKNKNWDDEIKSLASEKVPHNLKAILTILDSKYGAAISKDTLCYAAENLCNLIKEPLDMTILAQSQLLDHMSELWLYMFLSLCCSVGQLDAAHFITQKIPIILTAPLAYGFVSCLACASTTDTLNFILSLPHTDLLPADLLGLSLHDRDDFLITAFLKSKHADRMSADTFNQALIHAKNVPAATAILNSEHANKIPAEGLISALLKIRDASIIQTVLDSAHASRISLDDLGKALIKSDPLILLSTHGHIVPTEHLINALFHFSFLEETSTVKVLLKHLPDISSQILGKTLIYASDLLTITTLLNHPLSPNISPKDLGSAVAHAKGLPSLKQLLTHPQADHLTENVFDQVLHNYAFSADILSFLLESRFVHKMSHPALRQLFHYSIHYNPTKILTILDSAPNAISPTDLSQALRSVALAPKDAFSSTALHVLLYSSHISNRPPADLDDIFYRTATSGHLHRAETFLAAPIANNLSSGLRSLTPPQLKPLLSSCSASQLFSLSISNLRNGELKFAAALSFRLLLRGLWHLTSFLFKLLTKVLQRYLSPPQTP